MTVHQLHWNWVSAFLLSSPKCCPLQKLITQSQSPMIRWNLMKNRNKSPLWDFVLHKLYDKWGTLALNFIMKRCLWSSINIYNCWLAYMQGTSEATLPTPFNTSKDLDTWSSTGVGRPTFSLVIFQRPDSRPHCLLPIEIVQCLPWLIRVHWCAMTG